MTIWNALSAGGALWFAVYATLTYVAQAISTPDTKMTAVRFFAGLGASLAFGLCLWGAIP